MTGAGAAGRPPIKVHRVVTVEEARALDAAGVEYIGFHVDDDAFLGLAAAPVWDDARCLLLDQLPELLGAVRRARPFVECARDAADGVLAVMRAHGVSLLQVDSYALPGNDWLEAQARSGVGIVYGHQYVVPEDDPRFLGLIGRSWPGLFGIDLQVFPSEGDAWRLFNAPSPELTRDILLRGHFERLAATLPLFLSFNFDANNCRSIAETLSVWPLKGLSLTLSGARQGAFHSFEFDEAMRIVEALGPAGGRPGEPAA